MQKQIRYKNFTINVLFPSGYYEYYSTKHKRFLKFDELEFVKYSIDLENSKIK
jgi:hypothetical protein